jgi:hypothetical protein
MALGRTPEPKVEAITPRNEAERDKSAEQTNTRVDEPDRNSRESDVREAWQQPELSKETIGQDRWTAVYLPIPEKSDPRLLAEACRASAACIAWITTDPDHGPKVRLCRRCAQVAFVDATLGYGIRVHGKTEIVGGTGAAAPLWAGLVALINQELQHNIGYFNPERPSKSSAASVDDGIREASPSGLSRVARRPEDRAEHTPVVLGQWGLCSLYSVRWCRRRIVSSVDRNAPSQAVGDRIVRGDWDEHMVCPGIGGHRMRCPGGV